MHTRLRLTLLASLALLACDNKLPSAPVVAIAPTNPRTDDDLKVAVVTTSADLDGQPVTYRIQWTRDGTVEADLTADTVPAARTKKGETWGVVVTPNDGLADGVPGQAQVTVANTPPVVTVALEPSSPTVKAALKAVPTAADADEEAVTFTYAWTRDGRTTDFVTDEIPAAALERGQNWAVTVLPNDGEVQGAPVKAVATIGNSPPVLAGVALSPETPTKLTPIVAQQGGVSDADGDAVTTRLTWRVAGMPLAAEMGPILPVTAFARGQEVEVTATPTDGMADGAPVSSRIIVGNSAPSGLVVQLDAATATEGVELTCSVATAATDADGDALAYVFAWKRDGVAVAGTGGPVPTQSRLAGADVVAGTTISCSAVAVDPLLALGPESAAVSLLAIGCGDAIVQPGEACDDGNAADNDACRNDCTWYQVCGDSVVQPGETCDDGNTADADGCTARCQWEPCTRDAPMIEEAPEPVYPLPTSVWIDEASLTRLSDGAALVANTGFGDTTDDLAFASAGWALQTVDGNGRNWASCRYDANVLGANGTALGCLYGLAPNGGINTIWLRQEATAMVAVGEAFVARYCLRGTVEGQTARVAVVNDGDNMLGLDRTVHLSTTGFICESQSFTATDTGRAWLVVALSDPAGATHVVDTNASGSQASLTLPFGFRIPGGAASSTAWRVGTVGMITSGSGAENTFNQAFPSGASPNGVLAPFWDDLRIRALPTSGTSEPASMAHWKIEGVSPERTLVVEWRGATVGWSDQIPQFQLRAVEDGRLTYHYDAMSTPVTASRASATIGVEDETGTVGVTTACRRNCGLADFPASKRLRIGRPMLCGTSCTTDADCNPTSGSARLTCSAPAGEPKTCR